MAREGVRTQYFAPDACSRVGRRWIGRRLDWPSFVRWVCLDLLAVIGLGVGRIGRCWIGHCWIGHIVGLAVWILVGYRWVAFVMADCRLVVIVGFAWIGRPRV